MTLRELFRAERSGNVSKINGEYYRIRQEHHDRFLGSEMMKNDLQENRRLWADAEQAALDLFQHIDNNRRSKDEIICQLEMSPRNAVKPISGVPSISRTDIPLKKAALLRYKRAYDLSTNGDYTAFRNEALDYRITSGLKNRELKVIVQYMREITAIIEVDDLNIDHLWRLYQKSKSASVESLLYPALSNCILKEDNFYVEEYINSVNSLKLRLEREGL